MVADVAQPSGFEALTVLPGFLTPTLTARVSLWIPVVGWIVGNELEKRRICKIAEIISNQLRSRDVSCRRQWAGERESIAALICHELFEHLDWPNDLFIPADNMQLILVDSDCRFTDVLEAIEQRLQIPSGSLLNADFEITGKTNLGDVVDWINSIIRRSDTELSEGVETGMRP